MNIHQTKDTLSVAEAVKKVLAPDVQLEKKISETEIAPADKAAHDDHVVDKKKNPESEKQTEENLTEDVDNFFGFPTKDGLVKFQSMAKKLKIRPISNPVVMKRGGKEFHVMGFEGSVRDIEKAMKVAAGMQEESVDFTKEGNEFTAAAAKAKLDGKDEFEFDGKKYPVEIGQDAAEKILGKKESAELDEGILDKIKKKINPKKAKAREDLTRLAKTKKKIKELLDKIQAKADEAEDGDEAQEILDKGDKLWMKLDKIESEMAAIRKDFPGLRPMKESVELQEAADFGDIEKVMKWAKKNLSGAKLDISKKYGTAFINLTIFNIIILRIGGKKGIVVTHDDRTNGKGKDYEEHFSSANDVIKFVQKIYDEMPKDESAEVEESADLEEAVKPEVFVKGGDTKVTKREVDGMLSKIFINNKLAKQVEDSEAYQAGEKGKGKKKNPYKKDTADFQLYELGVQSSQAS